MRRFHQVNTRWKALAEIYTKHSFAPFWNQIPKNQEKTCTVLESTGEKWGKKGLAKTTLRTVLVGSVSNLNFFVKNRQNFFAIELMNIH